LGFIRNFLSTSALQEDENDQRYDKQDHNLHAWARQYRAATVLGIATAAMFSVAPISSVHAYLFEQLE
jgi:hypothetical protein